MFLENLFLRNFKNYSSCSFKFNPGLNFIYGENGNGKTNVLEAISFLCYTKSFLQNSDFDCIKNGESDFELKGVFINSIDTQFKIDLDYRSAESQKSYYLNSEKINKLNDVLGLFPLITLSPYDLKITTGPPHERRRNFDLLISQTSKVYLNELRSLSRILKQKNTLLKDNLFSKKYSQVDMKQMIKGWNDELVNVSLKLIVRRLDFVENFRRLLEQSFKELVDLKYEPVFDIESDLLTVDSENIDLDNLAGDFRRKLDEKMTEEMKRGISLLGPHRDNYIFKLKKGSEIFDVRIFASQGEHKIFLIALKLAEFKYISTFSEGSYKGEPILVLDDVFSELDSEKINKVCGILPSYNQLFVTSTEKGFLDKLNSYFAYKNFGSFEIADGRVVYAA